MVRCARVALGLGGLAEGSPESGDQLGMNLVHERGGHSPVGVHRLNVSVRPVPSVPIRASHDGFDDHSDREDETNGGEAICDEPYS